MSGLHPTTDIDWHVEDPNVASTLEVQTGKGNQVLLLRAADGWLTASSPAGPWQMPLHNGRLRVSLDGPVCEVFASSGPLALPVASAGGRLDLALGGQGEVLVYPLEDA